MTVRARKRTRIAAVVIAAVASAATLLPIVASPSERAVREVRIVVRDMTFYVDGKNEPNPVITFRAGEQVRVRLRNEDPGMRHDFSIQAWTVATKTLEDRGEEDEIVFRVPEERSTQSYRCTPHAKMMSGTIRVE
jgi:hypothetical protein